MGLCNCDVEDEAKVEERRREAEREADQREKEEFEERLRARDDEKTRRIVEQRIPKEELEVRAVAVRSHISIVTGCIADNFVTGCAAWRKLRAMANLAASALQLQPAASPLAAACLLAPAGSSRPTWLAHCCGAQDAKRRKYETEEERDDLLPRLRDFSRQEYLKKREDAKLQELEDAIRDEEMMFGCVGCGPAAGCPTWQQDHSWPAQHCLAVCWSPVGPYQHCVLGSSAVRGTRATAPSRACD